MKRDLVGLTTSTYDLLVIGGGIYGACVAWEATLRGLSVALVEKGDFGCATSANSLKIIHGGLRYLQHADIKRMRESICERTILMDIAPHLIHPLPILLPTYGHGIKGKEAMAIALMINDLISFDRNLPDPQKYIPNGRVISAQECKQLLPGIPSEGLSGGAIFCDAQVYNSERLTLAFLHSATQGGAKVANYTEVTGFLQSGKTITGVKVQDVLTGDNFDICAKTVVNTSGPWINQVLDLLPDKANHAPLAFAKAMNLVLRRPLFEKYAVGIYSQQDYNDPDALLNKGSRLLFTAPWRGTTMVGTAYTVWDEDADSLQVTEEEIDNFLKDINQAYPFANLTREDVAFVHSGLLPRSGVTGTGEPTLTKHYQIEDHKETGLSGLISVAGVKYTTARDVAVKVLDQVFQSWAKKSPKSTSDKTTLYGGNIDRFDHFCHQALSKQPYNLSPEVIQRLVYCYGSAYPEVLSYLDKEPYLVNNLDIVKAEVLHGIHSEMAQTLSDIILRRTELGSAGYPGDAMVQMCGEVMAGELGWSDSKIKQEISTVNHFYGRKSALAV